MNKLQDPAKANLVYEGSVKRIWKPEKENDKLWFQFTDAYSVFDWGRMPDDISNKGKSLALMGDHFFNYFAKAKIWQELETKDTGLDKNWLAERFKHQSFKNLTKSGMPHHFIKLIEEKDKGEFLEVVQGIVPKATAHNVSGIKGNSVYAYQNLPSTSKEGSGERYLVPLEVVFRFGLPQGSSLIDRLKANPEYATRSLGLPDDTKIDPNSFFPYPVLEFYTKLEPSDRLLSLQEALLLSGLSAEQFDTLSEQTLMLAVALRQFFNERKIELWDGKFEFLVEYAKSGTKILLADSIGPDELRLIYKNCHLSKEILRQIYKDSAWAKELSGAKKSGGKDWKKMVSKGPDPLSADTKKIVDQLYPVITNCITGKELFLDCPDLDQYVKTLERVL